MASDLSEIWKPVPGYEDKYQVSCRGRVRRIASGKGTSPGRVLNPRYNSKGYVQVALYNRGMRKSHLVHKLVATVFLGPCPDGCEVAHGNGIRDCNIVENLRYSTPSDNCADKVEHGTHLKGEACSKNKLTTKQVIEIRKLLYDGVLTQLEIGQLYGVSREAVCDIKLGRSWGWLV